MIEIEKPNAESLALIKNISEANIEDTNDFVI